MDSRKEVQHVYLVGAKSLGAYGGYETFVYKLTEYHQNKENIKYHVACKANGDGCMDKNKFEGVTKLNDHEFELHNAHCFKINIPQIGPAQAIYYDVAALKACCEHIRKNHIPHAALVTLVIFMAIDYVTGLLVAGVFHNSGKTENGALESRAGWKGLCRKCITLLMVLVATRLDLVTGTNFIRDAVVIAFIANETISIVENAGLMGINIPPAITSAIEVLKKKSDSVDNTDQ